MPKWLVSVDVWGDDRFVVEAPTHAEAVAAMSSSWKRDFLKSLVLDEAVEMDVSLKLAPDDAVTDAEIVDGRLEFT